MAGPAHGLQIVHLTSREGLSAVYPAQVARPMSLIRDRGFNVTLAALVPVGQILRPDLRRRWRERRKEISESFGLAMNQLPATPSRASGLWDESSVLRMWLRRRYPGPAPVIVHCRGTQATRAALQATTDNARFSVLSDCRGIEAPEFLMERGYGRPEAAPADVSAEFAAKDERQGGALRRSAVVLCVSNAMRDEIAARWSIAPERVHVVPCCTDVEAGRLAAQRRDATRKRLGLERRFVVAYCGSAAPWQMLRESLAVYRRIRALRNDAHFLAITTGVTAVATAAEAACLPPAEHTIMSVPHADVADVLAAADVGLLIRDRSVVNRVASPVKFAEYLSCGVPVVLTEGIGDFSKLVRDLGLGSVLPDAGRRDSAVDDVESFMRSFATEAAGRRERCMAAARSHLSWATMIEVVSRTYEELAGACPFDTCSSLMAEPQARC